MEALAHTVTITLPDGSTRKVGGGHEPARGRRRRSARASPRTRWPGRSTGSWSTSPRGSRTTRRSRSSRRNLPRRSALSPLDGPPDGQRRQAPASRPSRSASGPRSRTATTTTSTRSARSRPRTSTAIEAEMRRIIAEDNPIERSEMSKDEAIRHLRRARRTRSRSRSSRAFRTASVSLLPAEGLHRPLPRPARPLDRQARRLQADAHGRRLLEGRREEPDAPADLRRLLPDAEGARRAPQAASRRRRARDHRKLGKELELFAFHPWAPASPFFLPKGAVLYNGLIELLRAEYRKRGYEEVITPQIFDVELFKTSGHYANYRENMFFTEVDERDFGVKPMNCPGHFLLFQTRLWSYRDLPVRFADFGRLHRYELSGVTAGPDARPHVLAGRRPHLHALREDRGGDLRVPRVPRTSSTGPSASRTSRSRSGCAPRSASAPTSSGPGRGGPRRAR